MPNSSANGSMECNWNLVTLPCTKCSARLLCRCIRVPGVTFLCGWRKIQSVRGLRVVVKKERMLYKLKYFHVNNFCTELFSSSVEWNLPLFGEGISMQQQGGLGCKTKQIIFLDLLHVLLLFEKYYLPYLIRLITFSLHETFICILHCLW